MSQLTNRWMDASIDRCMDGWIYDRRKHWGSPLSEHLWHVHPSLPLPSWPTLCGLSPLVQDFKLTWMLMKWYKRLNPENEAGSWSQARVQLPSSSPRKSQTLAHSWKPIMAPQDEGCKTHPTSMHLAGPPLRFAKRTLPTLLTYRHTLSTVPGSQ